MYFEPRVTFPPRSREFSGNPITVSWHLGQNIERNINQISARPLSFIFAATRTGAGAGLSSDWRGLKNGAFSFLTIV